MDWLMNEKMAKSLRYLLSFHGCDPSRVVTASLTEPLTALGK